MDLISLAIGIAVGATFPLFFKKIWEFAKKKFAEYKTQ